MATQTEIDEMRKWLNETGYFPVLRNDNKEPYLVRDNRLHNVTYVSIERFITALDRLKLTVNKETGTVIPDLTQPTAPTPEPAPKETNAKTVWSIRELENKTRKQLQAIAKKQGVKANLSTADLIESLTGRTK